MTEPVDNSANSTKKEVAIDAKAIDRGGQRFVNSDEFKKFTYGWGLYDHSFSSKGEYKSYIREFVGPESKATNDEDLAKEFYKEYRKQASTIGKMLQTELKNASHQHFGAKCDYCGTGVFDEKMETTASTLGKLDEISSDPKPNLIFDNEFVLTCNSCGGPTEVLDLDPITQRFGINLVEEQRYAWGFQKKDQVIGADITLVNFINTAVLRPFQEGKDHFVNRMVEKMSDRL